MAYEKDKMRREHLIKELAGSLMKSKDIGAAIVCFILSGSVEQVLSLWRKRAAF